MIIVSKVFTLIKF